MDVREVVTPVGFLSYPHLSKPDQYGDDPTKARFTANLVVSGDGAAVRAVVGKAIKAAAADKFPGVDLAKLKMPVEAAKSESLETFGLEQGMVVKATNKAQPAFFDEYGDRLDPADPKTYSERLYPGALVRLSVWSYGWTYGPKRGVSLLLRGVQFVEATEPIGSSSSEVTMEGVAERPPTAAEGAAFPVESGGDPVEADHWPDDDAAPAPPSDDGMPF